MLLKSNKQFIIKHGMEPDLFPDCMPYKSRSPEMRSAILKDFETDIIYKQAKQIQYPVHILAEMNLFI